MLMAHGKMQGYYDAKQNYIRTDTSDGDRDMESNFYVLKHTSCPAVLTENFFQDNKSDVDYKDLGRYVFGELDRQTARPAEYVEE